jgi:tetratricopeptide (TPR) repeat protein/tRNA A-37 threonylcarbamoyl transferase component Bud32
MAEQEVPPTGASSDPDLVLGTMALERGMVRAAQFAEALEEFRKSRSQGHVTTLEEILTRRGWLTPDDAARLRREQALRAEGLPVLDRYDIQVKIGEGATASVFRAWDRELKRRVAVKILRDTSGLNARARERFRREAQTAASLDHPNVLRVFDAGEASGHLYLVMELVEGRPLDVVLHERSRPLPEILSLLERAARGVAAAHARGIVHRDLKPANILLTAGDEPKIADFGLAFNPVVSGDLTRSGVTMGTPLYMSPEQVRGKKEASPRSDVFSFGAILYEATIGQPPFAGQTLSDIYGQILDTDPVAPRRAVKSVARDLESIILKCLEKNPERRYAEAGALADDLRRYLSGEPVTARPIPPIRKLWRWARHRRALLLPAAALLLAAAGGLAWTRTLEARNAARVDALLEDARRREAEGRTEDARAAFRGALDLAPGRPEAREGLERTSAALEAALKQRADREAARSEAYRLLERGRELLEVAIRYQYSPGVPAAQYRAKLEEARRTLSEAVNKEPGLPLGHLLLGRAWEMLGDPEAAEAEFRDAASRDPESALVRYHLGRLLMHRTAFMIVDELARWISSNVDAQEILHYRLRERDKNGPATEKQAAEAGAEIEKATTLRTGLEDEMQAELAAVMLHYTRKDWGSVRRLCGEATRKFAGRPGVEEFHLWLALTHDRRDEGIAIKTLQAPGRTYGFQIVLAVENAEVGKLVDQALQAHPRFTPALYVRALFRIQTGHLPEARKDLDAILELAPKLAPAYVARALIRDRRTEGDAALSDLDRALRLARRPEDRRDAYLIRFMLLKDRGDEKGAQESLTNCVESDPTDWLCRYIRGEERIRLEQYDGALEDLNACLRIQPRFIHAKERRGYAYKFQRKYDLALKDYDESLRADPNSLCVPMTLTLRAEVYFEMGKVEECEATLKDALGREMSPAVRGYALRIRANLYASTRRYEEAMEVVETFLGLTKDKMELGWAYHVRSLCLTMTNRIDEALENINRSIELRPQLPDPYFLRAKIKEQKGDMAGAVEDARKSLRLGAKEPVLTEIHKLLKSKGGNF